MSRESPGLDLRPVDTACEFLFSSWGPTTRAPSSDTSEAVLRDEAEKFRAEAVLSDRPGFDPSLATSYPCDTGESPNLLSEPRFTLRPREDSCIPCVEGQCEGNGGNFAKCWVSRGVFPCGVCHVGWWEADRQNCR